MYTNHSIFFKGVLLTHVQ